MRLDSFGIGWPCTNIKASDLANAGFYWTGDNDRVRCFECRMEFACWKFQKEPIIMHRQWVSNCRFVRGKFCGNVPIEMPDKTMHPINTRVGRKKNSERLLSTTAASQGLDATGVASWFSRMCFQPTADLEQLDFAVASSAKKMRKSEYNQARDVILCKCCSSEVLAVLLPCEHIVACVICKTKSYKCPICN